MTSPPHILILGAGLIGLSSADALLRLGANVTLVEKESAPMRGASYANSGMIHPSQACSWAGSANDPETDAAVFDLACRSWTLMEGRMSELGLIDMLSLRDVTLDRLAEACPFVREWSPMVAEQIEITATYSGYLERQEAEILAYRKEDGLKLPANLNYAEVGSLSNELVEKLTAAQPTTLGAAGRIQGMTPAALASLYRYVKRGDSASDAASEAAAA